MKKEKKLISFPADMIPLIKEFGRENFITTFTGAVVELVRRGLENTNQDNNQTESDKNLKELRI